MNRNVIIALVLIVLCVVILLSMNGHVSMDLVITQIKPRADMAFLSFMVIGVIVGLLLK